MMTISGISGTGIQAGGFGTGQAADAYSRNIKKQIADVQKELQELSSDETLSMEDKLKKRQELQQEITDLNQQLRQHELETRRQEKNTAQKSGGSMEQMLGGGCRVQKKSGTGGAVSQATMTTILSAGASLGQVRIQSQVKSSLEGRAGVLRAELKQETGKSKEAKEAELAELEERADDVAATQMSTLSEINREFAETADEDGEAGKTEAGSAQTGKENNADEAETVEAEPTGFPAEYRAVDIRL